jgi:hypothetical protein
MKSDKINIVVLWLMIVFVCTISISSAQQTATILELKRDSISLNFSDTLVLKNEQAIVCHVREIDQHYVYYELPQVDSLLIMVSIFDLESIHFENGIQENFANIPKIPIAQDFYNQGKQDAKNNYDGQKDFKKGMLDGALTYFIYIGIVMVIIDYRKQVVPNNSINNRNQDYLKGYTDSANSIKNRKLIGGYLVGLVAMPVLFLGLAVGIVASQL